MKIALCVLALLSGAATVHAAPVTAPCAAAIATEKDGLRVSIKSIELRASDPHINVVLRNTSTSPVNVFQGWNSWGYYSVSLEITKMDGKVLTKPLVVKREEGSWLKNFPATQPIAPGGTFIWKVALYHPASKGTSEAPMGTYRGFPFGAHRVTMRAIFQNHEGWGKPGVGARGEKVWQGRIASPPTNYRVSPSD